MRERDCKTIDVVLGVVDGGIGINWEHLDLELEDFKEFLHVLLAEMGFPKPRRVNFEKNLTTQDGEPPRVDWFRPRINQGECEVQGVNPSNAVWKARRWLGSSAPYKWGRRFQTAADPIPA